MPDMQLRTMTDADRSEVAEMIYASINFWYQTHGCPQIFRGGPQVADVFYEVYNDLTPGANVVAVEPRSGRLMGSCYYHPRKHHVSLGIMTVHPNYFGCGVGGKLLKHIIDYTDENGYKALRLTQSAINVDSFSLYNKAGFVPRYSYQDMLLPVPENGLDLSTPDDERVRLATLDDVSAMAGLEFSVSGISREPDYKYAIENPRGYLRATVIDSNNGVGIDGFMLSCGHPGNNMLGPCVARDENAAAALILNGLNHYPGKQPVFLIPMDKPKLVHQMYDWGARNCEMHFCQVRGDFQPFNGINMPSFLPETG